MTIVHMDQNVDASRDKAVIHGITCWYHERFSVLLVVNEGSGLCLLYRKHEQSVKQTVDLSVIWDAWMLM